MDKVSKLGVEDESACLLVTKKLLLKTKPHLPSSGIEDHYDLKKFRRNCDVDPRVHDTVHAAPLLVVQNVIREDWSTRAYLPRVLRKRPRQWL